MDTYIEWSVVRCGSKNGHQKDILCLKEIGLCTQNLLTIFGLKVNIIESTSIQSFRENEILHLIIIKIFK
jgi:hypothetical protein